MTARAPLEKYKHVFPALSSGLRQKKPALPLSAPASAHSSKLSAPAAMASKLVTALSVAAVGASSVIVNDFDSGATYSGGAGEGWYKACGINSYGNREVDFHMDYAGEKGEVTGVKEGKGGKGAEKGARHQKASHCGQCRGPAEAVVCCAAREGC